MTLGELIARFRIEVGDNVLPYKTTDEDATEYANEAEEQACRRANLLVDTQTSDTCNIQLSAGQAVYALDPRVIRVKKVRLTGRANPLDLVSWRDMDALRPGWESHTGRVTASVQDAQTGSLLLYRIPDADAIASTPEAWLTVSRLPMKPMAAETDSPEINQRFHRALIHWMKFKHYSNDDPDYENNPAATRWYSAFEAEFGPLSRAIDEEWEMRHEGWDKYDGSL